MYGYIYETINLLNGKKYIGKHKSSVFDNTYYGSGKVITQAIAKEGVNNFKTILLEECDTKEELNKAEKYWIKYYNAQESDMYYNIAPGGDGGIIWEEGHHPSSNRDISGTKNPFFGKHHSEESKRKMSAAKKGISTTVKGKHRVLKDGVIKYVTEEELDYYINNGWSSYYLNALEKRKNKKPRVQSEETKKKISDKLKGRKFTLEHTQKISCAVKNRTEEERLAISQHMSEAHKGKTQSSETKRKKSEKLLGKKRTPEVKKRMSDAQKLAAQIRFEKYGKQPTFYDCSGTMWVHKFVDNKKECHMIKPEELEKYLADGFIKGRGKLR